MDETPINIYKVNTKRTVLSEKSYANKDSFKYFIGYIHKNKVFPASLSIKISQMNGCSKYFDKIGSNESFS